MCFITTQRFVGILECYRIFLGVESGNNLPTEVTSSSRKGYKTTGCPGQDYWLRMLSAYCPTGECSIYEMCYICLLLLKEKPIYYYGSRLASIVYI